MMLYAIIQEGKVVNTVIWDGNDNLFADFNVLKATEGVSIGYEYDGTNFIPIPYKAELKE
ncbi:hypothetical protein ACT48S_004048 [Cronobacter sakazakii]|nr:hypothetical protein [Cronobacter sakazakii]